MQSDIHGNELALQVKPCKIGQTMQRKMDQQIKSIS
ncbi:unnamed protein product [Paramecium sonneborni]|uniref:Uncharacterized protein n=1 Tax=Paramecium sonneborni TaxID=65129 RepID=A0A8S1RNS2_9CILI|nr:unnamed protein product [Paramecium sonneborni]CAD8128455.1 unnamed protein product [Paramecium sonneborni]